MPTERDYYDTLGVPRNASADDLKSAFRKLARQYHPDVNKASDAEERFKEINEAYAVLSDPERRAAYDRFGRAGLNGMGGVPDWTTIDFSDILEGFFGFGMGGSRQRRNAPRRGQDLSMQMQLSFEESVHGVENEIEFTRDEECSGCKGTGAEPGTGRERCETCTGRGEVRTMRQTLLGSMVQVTTCPACEGTGEVIHTPCRTCRGRKLERKTIKRKVTIPAGVDHGTQIRLAGEGQPGSNGGPHGNLYLEIKVKPHPFFKRREDDIILELGINIAQAALGAEVEVPTIDGKSRLNIPAGTQPGKVFTIKNKGVPHVRASGRGDHMVIINVQVPASLTAEQRAIFENLGATMGTEVKPQERSFFDRVREVLGG
jgi:molecular chaperone DnaJ